MKFIEDSIQIVPHDFPFSGWYGYHDATGTETQLKAGVVPAATRSGGSRLSWTGPRRSFPWTRDA